MYRCIAYTQGLIQQALANFNELYITNNTTDNYI
jgi:hypothetical protein